MSQFSDLKSIRVTCALIEHEGKILCARRSKKMKHPLKWEFPGGKVEQDEPAPDCLHREILEELGITIELLEQLPSFRHDYAGVTIELLPFRCRPRSTAIQLAEHREVVWLPLEELKTLDWVEADVAIVKYLERLS